MAELQRKILEIRAKVFFSPDFTEASKYMGADLENLRQTDSSGITVQHDKSLGDAFFQVLPKSYDLENNRLKKMFIIVSGKEGKI